MTDMKILQNRTIGFYAGAAAAVILLAADIVFLVTDSSDRTFSWITFGLIAAGVVCEVLTALTDLKLMPLLTAVCWGAGLSYHLYIGLPTLSDIMNGVVFVGGSAQAVIVFGVIFGIGTVIAVIACFMDQRKPIELVREEANA